jgi:hypothetical protein
VKKSNKIVFRGLKDKSILLFALLLAACATTPPAVVVAKVPRELAAPVDEPEPAGRTNGDLAAWADELRAALRAANERLRRIRDL